MPLMVYGALYVLMVYGIYNQAGPVCAGILIFVPLAGLFYNFVVLPREEHNRKQEAILEQTRLRIECDRSDALTLYRNNHRCQICGGTNNVVAVDGKTFVKSTSSNSQRITVCEDCQVDRVSPRDFELLVGKGFTKMGYEVIHKGGPMDGGIDLLCTKPGVVAIVQCKHYHGSVGISAIRDFYGTVVHSGATKGYFVTTGSFTLTARNWIKGKPIQLVGKAQLAQVLIGDPRVEAYS